MRTDAFYDYAYDDRNDEEGYYCGLCERTFGDMGHWCICGATECQGTECQCGNGKTHISLVKAPL